MRTIAYIAAAGLSLLLVSCATSQVNSSAFSKPRTLALVSVSATVTGLATGAAQDREIAADLTRVSHNEINRSRYIRLVPQAAVLRSKTYKAIKDEGPTFMGVVAPGYKRFTFEDEKARLQALAKELKVDGFVFVQGAYGKKQSGIGIGGLLSVPIPITVGRSKPYALFAVVAYDVNGNVLWQDQLEKTSDEGITTVMGVGAYKSLIPKFTDLMKAASRELVAKLETQVAAK
jgi:hypothetical protein